MFNRAYASNWRAIGEYRVDCHWTEPTGAEGARAEGARIDTEKATMQHITDIDAIDSNDKVLDRLEALSEECAEGLLYELRVFNTAYWVVTKAIGDSLAADSFSHPEIIEDFTVCFARYYFEAINGLMHDDSVVPVAWTKLTGRKKPQSPSISLLMGANAHINHDLALALLETMDKRSATDFLPDLVKIDRLLIACAREILGTYDESSIFLSFVKRRCQWLYFRPVMSMIRFWRVMAFYNFRSMQRLGGNKANFAHRSIKIANRFLQLGEFFG